jgi:hypothetical protein
MINKVTPRKLNPSLDSRLRKKDEMLDAINIDIKSDNDGDSGDVGVLKPVKGMTKLDFQNISTPSDGEQIGRRVIGSVTDEKNDIIFYFLFSEINSEQGVYAYDPNGNLSDDENNELIKPVYQSSYFNFPQNGFVKADVVYTTNHEVCNLYFTDNRNEPRRLDVKRARSFTLSNAGAPTEAIDIVDFITACPKTPIHPISFEFIYNADYQVSEFRNIPGFQFAYQCIYASGEESAISTYSDIAVPPSYVQQGTINTPNLLAHNTCRLTIPKEVDGVEVYSFDIEKIRILGRIGNLGTWYTIDEVNTTNANIIYDFRNDRVLTGVPDEDVQKQFTSLPRKAQAQTVVDNRLFYGNYVESFDEPTVSATMTVYYRERPTDFVNLQLQLEEIVLPAPDIAYDVDGINYDGSYVINRKAGYKMTTENIPDYIEQGTVMTVNLTVHPDAAFKIYDTKSGSSYHLSKNVLGRKDTYSRMDEGAPGGEKMLTERNSYGGKGAGVFDSMSWTPEDTSLIPEGETAIPVVCGTSASNALSIAGRALTFSCTIEFNQEISSNTKEVVRNAVCQAISGGSVSPADIGTNITVIDSVSTSSYSYNIGLNDEDGVDNIPVVNGDDYRKRLINAVLPVNPEPNQQPLGYFIINSADVSFSLNRNENPQVMDSDEEYNGYLYLDLDSLTNIQTKNCIPVPLADFGFFIQANSLVDAPNIHSWAIYSNSYAGAEILYPNILDVSNGEEETVNYNGFFEAITHVNNGGALNNAANEQAQLYWPLFFEESSIYGSLTNIGDLVSDFSLLDGEQGPDSLTFKDLETYITNVATNNIIPNNELNTSTGSVNYLNLFGDQKFTYTPVNGTEDRVIKRIGVDLEDSLSTGNVFPISYRDAFNEDGESILEKKACQVEIIDFNSYLTDSGLVNYDRSFKTESNHDFGVVYYDERGRAGNVNKLPTVYVPGYSAEERGSMKGRVEIGIQLNHEPPEWAHHYQIVYAGNSSVSDFIQYTTGGAFVAQESEEGSQNIYVSLNYLQQHPTVSYSKDFGAVSNEGINDMYTFKQGDRLRIISYYTNNEDRIWPRDYDFEIIDSVILTEDVDTNPLIGSTGDSDEQIAPRTGRFLILKNSPFAAGFTYQDVLAAEDVNTNSHHWNDRCVVEIYSPLDKQSSENRVYHETGNVYNTISFSGATVVHQTNPVLLRNGDVWWRRVPVNMPDYDENNNLFTNLITSETSPSKFRDYYLETNRFNDTLVDSKQYSFGKIKTISPINKEIRRDSSITYSDKNNYASPLVRFTSFNPYKLQFKDLPAEHGAINYILNYSDSVFCIQEEKTSVLPVDRSILSDASGVESLIASSKVLGTQKFYAGAYGCDDNPESVVKVDNFVYFANKSRQQVYRFSPDRGVSVISEAGMKQYFRYLFNRVLGAQNGNLGVRIVGGYDPLKDEFLISIMNATVLTEPTPLFYEPPVSNQIIDEVSTSTGADPIGVTDVEALEVVFEDLSVITAGPNGVIATGAVTIDNIEDPLSLYVVPLPSSYEITGSELAIEIVAEAFSSFGEIASGVATLYSDSIITDSSVIINTGENYLSLLDPETEYNLFAGVFNNAGSMVAYEEIAFTTPSEGVGPVEIETVYDIADFQYEYDNGFSEPIGYITTVNTYSNASTYSVNIYLIQGAQVADDINWSNGPIGIGDSASGLFDIFSQNVVATASFTNLEPNQILTLTSEPILTYTVTTGGGAIDVSQPHLAVVYLSESSTIKDVLYSPIPAFVEVALSPTPLSIIATEGLSAVDADTISGLYSSGLTAAIQSILANPSLANQLTSEQELSVASFVSDVDSDLNLDDIIGTADLLMFLSAFTGDLNPLLDLGSQGVEGFEVFNRDDEERLLIEPGSSLLDDLE